MIYTDPNGHVPDSTGCPSEADRFAHIKDKNEMEKEAERANWESKLANVRMGIFGTEESVETDATKAAKYSKRTKNESPDYAPPIDPEYDFRITSKFQSNRKHPVTGINQPHNGVDLAAANNKQTHGVPVNAPCDGTAKVNTNVAGGNQVLVECDSPNQQGNKVTFGNAHLDKQLVVDGQKVTKGQQIGTVGNTGLSNKDHLHFSARENGNFVNPNDTFNFYSWY